MNKHSENKDAAWKAIKAGTSPKGIEMYLEGYPGNLPAHTDVEWTVPEQTNNPNWKAFEDIFNSGKSYGFWSVSKLSDTFFDLSQKVVYDRIDPMRAGKRLHKQWSQKASEI